MAWPFHLASGDDIWLSGLHIRSIWGWVVTIDADALRIRFYHDKDTQALLRQLVDERFAATARAE